MTPFEGERFAKPASGADKEAQQWGEMMAGTNQNLRLLRKEESDPAFGLAGKLEARSIAPASAMSVQKDGAKRHYEVSLYGRGRGTCSQHRIPGLIDCILIDGAEGDVAKVSMQPIDECNHSD